jgi:hypothetical protein
MRAVQQWLAFLSKRREVIAALDSSPFHADLSDTLPAPRESAFLHSRTRLW